MSAEWTPPAEAVEAAAAVLLGISHLMVQAALIAAYPEIVAEKDAEIERKRRAIRRNASERDKARAEVERLREIGEEWRANYEGWVAAVGKSEVGRDEALRKLAAVAALADSWRCNCGGPSPEGHHEMLCDSYYGNCLRAVLADHADTLANVKADEDWLDEEERAATEAIPCPDCGVTSGPCIDTEGTDQ